MGWTEEQFWSSTFYAMSCAYIGKLVENGQLKLDASTMESDVEDFRRIDAMVRARERGK